MYAFIEGNIEYKGPNSLVLNANGVGYEIFCTQSTLSQAPKKGESMRVYTYLSVREDAMELMGFVNREEKEMFISLISVSGVGAKTAIGILGALNTRDLSLAIATEDITSLSRAPGVGKKTAQRIALELKDKISKLPFGDDISGDIAFSNAPSKSSSTQEAMLALQGLGYTQGEAYQAVKLVKSQLSEDAMVDDIVRAALKGMMKG